MLEKEMWDVSEYIQELNVEINGQNGSSFREGHECLDAIAGKQQTIGITSCSPSGRKKLVKKPVSSPRVAKESFGRQALENRKVSVKPKCCRQAVIDYCRLETYKGKFRKDDPNVDMKQVRDNAKRHLAFEGWKFKYVRKASGKQELRYCSPMGKSFASLLTACKAWMKNAGVPHEFKGLATSDELESDESTEMVESDQSTEMVHIEGSSPSFTPPEEPFSHKINASGIGEDEQNVSTVAFSCKKKLRYQLDSTDGSRMPSGKVFHTIEHDDKSDGCHSLDCSPDYRLLRNGKVYKACNKSEATYQSDCSGSSGMLKIENLSQSVIKHDDKSDGDHQLDCSGSLQMLNSGKLSQGLTKPDNKSHDSHLLDSSGGSIKHDDKSDGDHQLDCSGSLQMLKSGKLSQGLTKPDNKSHDSHLLDSSGGSKMLRQGKMFQDLIKQDGELDGGCSKSPVQIQKRARSLRSARLCLLMDNGVVMLGQKVRYMNKNSHTTMAEGKITREGIECDCCGIVYTLSSFEVHAKSTNHRPAAHIFLEDGRSLLDCQMQLGNCYKISNRKMSSAGSLLNGDNICSICHFGGKLVLCDHCPSCFHLSCIGLKGLPEGEWFCPSCRCGICGHGEFNGDDEQFSKKTVIYCDQCEREYHVGCLRERGMAGLDTCPKGNWFCNERCSEIFFHLHELLGKSNPTSIEGVSWTILRSREANGSNHDTSNVEAMTRNSGRLLAAVRVLQECFGSIVEPLTKRDLITDVLFNRGSQLNRLNFQGFYTMLLEKGDELVSVATIRVFGEKVAEMPLVGTRIQYRQQGMCRLLMNELEKMLYNMGVERLLLPAIPQMLDKWNIGFGFTKLTGSERLGFLRHVFLEFKQTTMCQKLLMGSMTTTTTTVVLTGNKEENPDGIGINKKIVEMDSVGVISKVIQPILPNEPVSSDNHREVGTVEETIVHSSSGGSYCLGTVGLNQDAELTKQCKRVKQISIDVMA